MGPYDPKMMRSIDSQFKKHRWFDFQKENFPKYKPLEKEGEHKEWFNRYFENEINDINYIITTCKPLKTDHIELVATVYACWQEAIQKQYIISDNLLIEKVYQWHESKDKFKKDQIESTIQWMIKKNIFPKK